MQSETLAKRYAAALYASASASNECHALLTELKNIVATLSGHSDLRHTLESPAVASLVKKNILKSLFAQRISGRALNFLYLIVDKGREAYVEAIVKAYEAQLKEDTGVVEARVEVAEPIDNMLETLILTRLMEVTSKRVEMRIVVNPELLAGVVITIGDRLYDGSLKYHLDEIRGRLVNA